MASADFKKLDSLLRQFLYDRSAGYACPAIVFSTLLLLFFYLFSVIFSARSIFSFGNIEAAVPERT